MSQAVRGGGMAGGVLGGEGVWEGENIGVSMSAGRVRWMRVGKVCCGRECGKG